MNLRYYNLIKSILVSLFFVLVFKGLSAQEVIIKPDISKVNDRSVLAIKNRDVIVDSSIHLNSKPKDGLLKYKTQQFKNCIIDVDIKGNNKKGGSFVGIAFQIQNDSAYDVVYFRPFNFQDSVKSKYSVQYVSKPEFEWYTLRNNFPNTYENAINSIVEPNNWFHATIYINYPKVIVYVNNSKDSSIEIEMLSQQSNGFIGFWVGNNSDGEFKNLVIKPIKQ